MKTQHKIAICILSSILHPVYRMPEEISENILSFRGGTYPRPQYAGTPVKTYSTPLPEFQPMQFAWFYKPPPTRIRPGSNRRKLFFDDPDP